MGSRCLQDQGRSTDDGWTTAGPRLDHGCSTAVPRPDHGQSTAVPWSHDGTCLAVNVTPGSFGTAGGSSVVMDAGLPCPLSAACFGHVREYHVFVLSVGSPPTKTVGPTVRLYSPGPLTL